MRLAFEGRLQSYDKLCFYDDYTWIQPTADGGIADGGEWEVVDEELHFKNSRRKKEDGKAVEELQVPFREWRQRLERQVAATIVGTAGTNY